MPNTKPPTTTAEALNNKLARMKNRAWCDYAFYIGADIDNTPQLAELEKMPGSCGVKIFMGSSTGSLLVPDDYHLEQVLRSGKRRVAIHAEDEFRLRDRAYIAKESGNPVVHPLWRDEDSSLIATKRIVELSKKTYRPIHLLHVSTYQEMEFLKKHKDLVTVECLPQFLTLHAPECYERLGTLAQMNPPIRSKEHQAGLWKALHDGTIDILATDHAPHTLQEKQKPYPESPSGMPGVQTLLPIMLNHVHEGRLSLEKLVELVCVNPSKIFGIRDRGQIAVGLPANLTILDTKAEREITSDWLLSKCGWSPYEGMKVTGWAVGVILRGQFAMWEDEIIDSPKGAMFEFYK
jgi:dihydroorotase